MVLILQASSSFLLLVDGCWLLVDGSWLLVDGYLLLTDSAGCFSGNSIIRKKYKAINHERSTIN